MTADTLLGQGLWERGECFYVYQGVQEPNVILYVLRRHLTPIK